MKIIVWQDHLRNGGTERQSLGLARHFVERGHEVELLVHRPGGRLFEQANSLGLPLRVLQTTPSPSDLWAPGLVTAIRAAGPAVVLAMGRVANLYAGWVQLRCPQATIIGTVRTGKVLSALSYASLRRTRGVIVNSEWWRERLLAHGFPSEHVATIYNSLLAWDMDDSAVQAQLRAATRASLGVRPETCVLLKVAGFRPGKRHRLLIEQLAQLARRQPALDWQLWLVGEGPEFQACQRLARQRGLDGHVRFLGYQERPQAFYAAADVAVSVSQEDSLPNFLIEAQAAALPAVVMRYRGVAETLLPGHSGYVLEPDDLSGFEAALVHLIADPAQRTTMGQAAVAQSRARFAREPQADAVLHFIERRMSGA